MKQTSKITPKRVKNKVQADAVWCLPKARAKPTNTWETASLLSSKFWRNLTGSVTRSSSAQSV